MKKAKLILGLGLASISTIPFLFVTSCLNKNSNSDIGNLDGTFGNVLDAIKEASEQIKQEPKNSEEYKALFDQPIIQITSSAKVNDNSFNQMVWEAIQKFSSATGTTKNTYQAPKSTSTGQMFQAYNNALGKGYKIWVLVGWSQESPFSKWLNVGSNKQKIKDKNIKIISIDWDVSTYLEPGQALSLNFKTQESSFLVGYSVSKFFGEKYPGEENKNKRILNTTAGADASGSTNFNYGFYEGMRAWNDEQGDDDSKKVWTNIYKNDQKVFLNTSYTDNNPETKEDFKLSVTGNGSGIFKEPTPAVTMPVAGDWSKTAANIIRETGKQNKEWVVGVDSNMAISYGSSYSNLFITSSEKRIGIATFKALCFLTGISTKVQDPILYPDQTNTNWAIKDGKIFNTKENKIENLSVNGGIELGYVGASKSTLENKDDAQRFDEIVDEAQAKFFGPNGLLETTKDQTKIDAFNEAKKSGNIDEYNKAVFELKNVLYGCMSAGNNGYFNMVVGDINKWIK